MTNLQKLTDLLCEVEEIKEDIMELRFGTKYYLEGKTIGFYTGYYESRLLSGIDERYTIYEFQYHKKNRALKPLSEIKIIGNPIEYHHLMMYCDNKKLEFFITNIFLLIGTNKMNGVHLKINNTLPLHKQSEEVLGALVEYISNIK